MCYLDSIISPHMNTSKAIVPAALLLGVLFLFLTYLYATHTANALPAYVPGHQAGIEKIHTKHALAALVLAIGSFVLAWFQSGPKAGYRTSK